MKLLIRLAQSSQLALAGSQKRMRCQTSWLTPRTKDPVGPSAVKCGGLGVCSHVLPSMCCSLCLSLVIGFIVEILDTSKLPWSDVCFQACNASFSAFGPGP